MEGGRVVATTVDGNATTKHEFVVCGLGFGVWGLGFEI